MIIAIEGTDGCGKKTQTDLLFKYLDYVFSNITLMYICSLYELDTLIYLMPIIANLII